MKPALRPLVIAFAGLAASLTTAQADSTIDPSLAFAYGANTGWINARPSASDGVVTGEFFLSGKMYAANFGWIDLGDGSPLNGHTYGNASATDYGVNHDGTGNLTGLAYGANIGWINFGWAAPNDPNRPRIDLHTGAFAGYAYSANTGYINLGTGHLATNSFADVDTDGDGMADPWEMQWFGDLATAGLGTDRDGDGQTDASEHAADTDPTNANEFLKIVSHGYDGAYTKVTLVFTSSPAREYRIEYDADLAGPWTNSSLGTFAPDAGATTTRIFTVPGSNRNFFRVVAVKPLSP